MKQRLLVMNGQRLVQTEQGGQWATDKVEKAGAVKPGIYNIHFALDADKSRTYDGPILHADSEHVYQQVGKSSFVKHALGDFEKVPEIGSNASITYALGAATAVQAPSARRLRHGIS
ncbi:MAG: KfrB domain-containing protein [Terriglobales bacterium]